jgi:hypothetical protein
MPEHVFTIASRGLTVDAQTNTLTVFSILEELGAPPQFPVALPELSLVTLWRRRPGEEGVGFVQRTRFIDPVGGELAVLDQAFRMEKPRHRMIGHIHMFPIRSAGCLRIEIFIRRDDDQNWGPPVASYPIEVMARELDQGQSLLQGTASGIATPES